ncbi:MAG: hypothetical protein IPP29_23770 [Bacteroidetes bacterium]|nr:hypothetical protein [Bacteroidota bacterium]
MTRKIIILGITASCFLLPASSFGQSIARSSISSAGGTLTGGSNQITFNIGETVIPSLSAGGSAITQGFEQPGEEVNTGTIASTLCPGSNVSLSFTAIDIGGGNTFTAQLSNSAGSFANAANIGTAAGNASGTINVTIPPNTAFGAGYLIRVISNSPVASGAGTIVALSEPIIITAVKSDSSPSGVLGSAGITFSPANCTILWSNGQTTNYISNIPAGTYTGTVTSPAGCVRTKSVTIN